MAAVLEREQSLTVELAGPLQQLLVAWVAGHHRELVHQLPKRGIDGNCGVGLLVGVDPDYDHLVPFRISLAERRTASGQASLGAVPRSYQVTLAFLGGG